MQLTSPPELCSCVLPLTKSNHLVQGNGKENGNYHWGNDGVITSIKGTRRVPISVCSWPDRPGQASQKAQYP